MFSHAKIPNLIDTRYFTKNGKNTGFTILFIGLFLVVAKAIHWVFSTTQLPYKGQKNPTRQMTSNEVTFIWRGGCYKFDTLTWCRKHMKEVGIAHAGQVTAKLNTGIFFGWFYSRYWVIFPIRHNIFFSQFTVKNSRSRSACPLFKEMKGRMSGNNCDNVS